MGESAGSTKRTGDKIAGATNGGHSRQWRINCGFQVESDVAAGRLDLCCGMMPVVKAERSVV